MISVQGYSSCRMWSTINLSHSSLAILIATLWLVPKRHDMRIIAIDLHLTNKQYVNYHSLNLEAIQGIHERLDWVYDLSQGRHTNNMT